MSFLDNIRKNTEVNKEQIEAETKGTDLISDINTFVGQGYNTRMKASEYLRAAIGWVYSCVGVISDEVAGINLKLMKVQGDELSEVDNHPAFDLIYKANNVMTKFDLIKLTFQYLELTGEAPWFLSFKNGKPVSILLLRPDRLTIKPGSKGELIGGYTYRFYGDGGFQEIPLEPQEVILFKYANPDQPLRGAGPLQAAATTYDLDNYAERWNTKFFKNSATPEAVLATDQKLSKETRERLERKMEAKYKGIDNSHKTIILEAGLKMDKLTLSQRDMDFIEQQRFSRDKILAIFRVPRTALGITDDVNRANAEATDYVFAKRTIKPKMQGFVEQLNEFLLPLFAGSENLMFDFVDPVPENIEQKIAQATAGIGAGYMTINEARELNGLDPIKGGDIIREPMQMNPIMGEEESFLKTADKKNKPTRGQKHLYNAKTRQKRENAAKRKAIIKIVSEALIPVIHDNLKKKFNVQFTKKQAVKEKIFSGDYHEQRAAKFDFQEKQLKLADSYEPKVISKLNTIFEEQKEIILRGLDNDTKLKLDINVETLRYVEKLKPVMVDLLRKQSKLAFQLLGQQKSFAEAKATNQTFTQRLSSYFESRTYRLAPQIVRETNDKLANAFAEAAKKEESIPQMKTRIRELFDNMEGYRSERIARTETIRGSNFATEEAYVESGVVEAKEWLATRDERTDDECLEMDGKIIPLRSNFFDKGDKIGNLELDYENVKFPPLHVNCRCTLIPVITTPLKEGEWRPTMNKDQAKKFIENSKFKGTLSHGTASKFADQIEKNGFNISSHDIGEGVYLTTNKTAAAQYAQDAIKVAGGKPAVLDVKINVKNFKVFPNTQAFVEAVEREFGELSNATATSLLKKYDAVEIRDIGYFIVHDPKNIVTLK